MVDGEDKRSSSVIGGECIGNVPMVAELDYCIGQYIVGGSKLNLAGLNERGRGSLAGVSTSQHHVKTVATELNLVDQYERGCGSLTDVLTNSIIYE